MPRPVHFEIHTSDPERAMRFYRELLGWEFTRWDGPMEYWLVKTGADGPGIDGGLTRRMGIPPVDGAAVNAWVCTVDVPSVDATLERLGPLGGTVALPKMPVPGVGWLGYGKDPDGNIWGFMQMDPAAA
jgi:predicted enzyme related to lactoylglutathione lyase